MGIISKNKNKNIKQVTVHLSFFIFTFGKMRSITNKKSKTGKRIKIVVKKIGHWVSMANKEEIKWPVSINVFTGIKIREKKNRKNTAMVLKIERIIV